MQGEKFPEDLSRGVNVEVGGVGRSGKMHEKFLMDWFLAWVEPAYTLFPVCH